MEPSSDTIARHRATSTSGSTTQHYRGIEGLRACAALSVMLAHATSLSGTYVIPHSVNRIVFLALHGVTLFFCLSGFLLYVPFVRAVAEGRTIPRVKTFYRHRLYRIAPAYVVIFVFASLVFGAVVLKAATYGEAPGEHMGRMTDPKMFLLNLFLLQGYVPSGVLTGLSVSWSLLPEVIFYLVLPGLALLGAWLARRFGAITAMLVPAIGLTVLGTIGRLITVHLIEGPGGVVGYTYRNTGATWTAVLSHSFFSQADLFGYGMIAAVLVVAARKAARRPRWLTWLAGASLVIGMLIVAGMAQQDRSDPFIGMFCSGLIALIVTAPQRGPSNLIARILDSPIPKRLGVTSYSIYLWHFAVVIFLTLHGPVAHTLLQTVGLVLLVAAITIVLAEITYRLVEAPAMRRARLTPASPAP